MKKKIPFYLIYFISLAIFAIPTYAFMSYFEDSPFMKSIGATNTGPTAVIVCLFPALLISIWWWNVQDDDD